MEALKISVQVSVVMEFNALNKKALSRYKELVCQSYITDSILQDIENSSNEEEIAQELATVGAL